ncbi:MAG TPA: hypothetical protein VGD78_04240 [Chthoniobacterales bacterium]
MASDSAALKGKVKAKDDPEKTGNLENQGTREGQSPPERRGDPGPSQVTAAHLSPALREAVYRTFARARLAEGDPLWTVLAATVEIHQAFLTEWQKAAPQGQATPAPGTAALGPVGASALPFDPASRDAQAALDRQTDEILRAIRAAQPPVRWWRRWEWLAALCASLLLAGFAFGYWLTWDWATAKASADANARVEALTTQLPEAERFSLLIQGFGGNVRWFNPPSPEGKPRALTLVVSTGRFKVEELKANDARNDVSFTVR